LAIRFVFDYIHPHRAIRNQSRAGKHIDHLKNLLVFTAGLLLTAQLLGLDLLPMDVSESAASTTRIFAVQSGTLAFVAMTWPRVMIARRHWWAGPMTRPVAIEGHRLVTWGPYKYVRHPFYAGMLIGVIAIELVVLSNLVFILLPLSILVEILITNGEERQLEEQYGDEYREFKKRTWRFFPYVY
jgi:protein-S-isoprenylcysteine O-methyltransferase Ste14